MLTLTTPPGEEPVTLDEAKAHLHVTHGAEDSYIEDFLIPTARQLAETATHRAFVTQTWTLRLSGFGRGPIVLPRPPLRVVEAIRYIDIDGNEQAWPEADYVVERPEGELALNGAVYPAGTPQGYPSTREQVDAVRVTFTAGYGPSDKVPVGIKHAVLMLVEDLYRHRGSAADRRVVETVRPAESVLSRFVATRYDLRYA